MNNAKDNKNSISKRVDELLENLHEKLLIGWIKNDDKTHTVPSHGNNDGCTDNTKSAILSLIQEARVEGYKKGHIDASIEAHNNSLRKFENENYQ